MTPNHAVAQSEMVGSRNQVTEIGIDGSIADNTDRSDCGLLPIHFWSYFKLASFDDAAPGSQSHHQGATRALVELWKVSYHCCDLALHIALAGLVLKYWSGTVALLIGFYLAAVAKQLVTADCIQSSQHLDKTQAHLQTQEKHKREAQAQEDHWREERITREKQKSYSTLFALFDRLPSQNDNTWPHFILHDSTSCHPSLSQHINSSYALILFLQRHLKIYINNYT